MFGEDLLVSLLDSEQEMADLEDEVDEKSEEIQELKAYIQVWIAILSVDS